MQEERSVYTKVYDVQDTLFSDKTGQSPKKSRQVNKYVMFMV